MSLAPAAVTIPDRFSIERRLGAGAFGTVFVVWDREREQRVALKRLERADPASIYRFKQEFRALADLVHPNLVRLHELFALDEGWCFTMDLVDGVRFDTWARGFDEEPDDPGSDGASRSGPRRGASVETLLDLPSPSGDGLVRALPGRLPFDEERARRAARGLLRGVIALHAAGILHRDLKPSNVLVERDGRVVILDFGLVATNVVESHLSLDGTVAGTPAYMSPEQAKALPLTAAADFYAVGAMLYEILCGHVPFAGSIAAMLGARTLKDVPDPRDAWQGLPNDLCDLSLSLLRRDPMRRPTAVELVSSLDLEMAARHVSAPAATTFVGRQAELAALERALAQAKAGKTVVAHVHGPSGYGKTTLLRRFLGGLGERHEVTVFEGRCYERESVPFKAFDELVDALGRHLARLRPVEAAALVPRDAPALIRLFPALGRLDVMASVPGRPATADAHELRRRAFGALREIVTRLGDSRTPILVIDDAQWGDADSAKLARHVLAPPDAPPLLLIVAHRSDGEEDNELLRTLRSPEAFDVAWETVDVPVGPLAELDALSLAASLLGSDGAEGEQSRAIAAESAGSPLFVSELARTAKAGRGNAQVVSLQRVVDERVASLHDAAKVVLELLACSERPLEEGELRAAAGLDAQGLSMAIDRLRDEHLLAVATRRGRTVHAIPHDKLRLSVRAGLDAARIERHHLALARALQSSGDAEPEHLAHHFRAAGVRHESLLWNERAGDQAQEAAAFERAVTLYGFSLEHAEGLERRRLMQKRAVALANAGRGLDAAEAYLSAAAALNGDAALELRQRAAEQFLRAGHVADALATFGPVLKQADLDLPKSPKTALASLLMARARLKLRGTRFRERKEEDVPTASLHRIDLCWSLGNGLSGIDLVRSASYHGSSLLLSLDAGEPYRVARALAMHAVMKALESAEGARHAEELADRAHALAERTGLVSARGWAAAARAIIAWGNSEFAACVARCDDAQGLLRERSQANFREIGSLEVWFALHSLFLLGELDRFAERAPACAREAEARGDRYTLSTVRAYDMPVLWAIRDRPLEGRREAKAAIEPWPEGVWYHQHWAAVRAHCLLDLYSGDGEKALERAASARPLMQRAMQLRIRTLRLELNYLEARGALSAALAGNGVVERTRLVEERVKLLDAEQSGLASVYAGALRAGLAGLAGGQPAVVAFQRVRDAFRALSMPLHASAAEHRIAELEVTGRPPDDALDRLHAHGVVAPERFVRHALARGAAAGELSQPARDAPERAKNSGAATLFHVRVGGGAHANPVRSNGPAP